MKNIKNIAIGVGILFLAFFLLLLYNMSQNAGNSGMMMMVVMLLLGLGMGGIIAYLLSRNSTPPVTITESSHTIAESMRKVFKIVSAEGHFSEIYNYEQSSKLFNFIPSKKSALVIVQAKVLIGYDFQKLKWEVDEITKKVRLIDFPAPEILSTETDYKYYNIEEQFYNLLSRDDLAKIQTNAKLQVIEAAKKSHLPQVAAEQMRTLLTEFIENKNFQLENSASIEQKALEYKLAENPVKHFPDAHSSVL